MAKHHRLISPPNWQFILQHPAYFIAFGLGSGLSRWAPGTVGTLIALLIYKPVRMFLDHSLLCAAIGIIFFIGIWASEKTSHALGARDYGGIVIDEFVGIWLVLIFSQQSWQAFTIAFVLFRFFDIAKPWPIRWIEKQVAGGLGIMLDDIIAALLTIVVMFLLQQVGIATLGTGYC